MNKIFLPADLFSRQQTRIFFFLEFQAAIICRASTLNEVDFNRLITQKLLADLSLKRL